MHTAINGEINPEILFDEIMRELNRKCTAEEQPLKHEFLREYWSVKDRDWKDAMSEREAKMNLFNKWFRLQRWYRGDKPTRGGK